MTPNEAGRLAHALNDLRPDWPISSVRTFIERELMGRAYRDAAVALTWVATDRKPDGTHASDFPKRVLEAGPWWRAANAGEHGETVPRHPTAQTACPLCGRLVGTCTCTPAELEARRKPDAASPSSYAEKIRASFGRSAKGGPS